MTLSRRTLPALTALLAASCALTGAASAQAAIHIDTPTAYSYTNDRTPEVTFSGSGPGENVDLLAELSTDDPDAGWFPVGSTDSDSGGAGNIVPAAPITSAANDHVSFRVIDTTTGSDDVGVIYVNVVPSASSGFQDGDTVAPENVEFAASGAIPDQQVVLFVDDDDVGFVTADEDGNASELTPGSPLAPGSHTAYLRTVDAEGNQSGKSTAITFNVSPPAPAFADLFDGAKLNQSQPALVVGGVDPSATIVTVSTYDEDSNGYVELAHTNTVTSGGRATVIPTLTDGTHSLVITQTVSGVESVLSNPYTVTVKTSAPVLEPVDALGNDARPYFSASNLLNNSASNNTKVKLYVDGQVAAVDDDFGGGTDSVQPDAPIADGAHSAYVTTVDDLGHESLTTSNTITFAIDTAAPALPTAVPPANGSTVTTATPQITLHTEPGVRVHLLVDDVQDEGDQVSDAAGNVTFTLSAKLADGTHTLYVWAADALGNATDVVAYRFTVKTAAAAPAPAVVPSAPVAPAIPAKPVAPAVKATPAAPTKVSLSSHTLTASKPIKVGFSLAKAGTVTVTITKVVKGKTVVVATVTVKAKAGKGSYTLHRKVGKRTLAKGSYKLSLQAVNGTKKSKAVSQKLTVG
jgi:large repetitive protein